MLGYPGVADFEGLLEGERALAGSRKSRDDDQAMPREIEVDVLEIVGARAADADVFHAVPIAEDASRACV